MLNMEEMLLAGIESSGDLAAEQEERTVIGNILKHIPEITPELALAESEAYDRVILLTREGKPEAVTKDDYILAMNFARRRRLCDWKSVQPAAKPPKEPKVKAVKPPKEPKERKSRKKAEPAGDSLPTLPMF